MSARSATDPAFIFCVHAHQPVGNFGHVFEDAYVKCYRPFFEALEKAPGVQAVVHLSGPLLDWLETEHPDFLKKLAVLAKDRDIEFLGGAYYEPIYGLISTEDLQDQIRMMQAAIQRHFGQTPEGVWLTERVWDSSLIAPLAACGVKYTVLDETSFEMAGLKGPVTGYYRAVAEDGASIDLFSSSKKLRYLIPFREPQEALRTIRQDAAADGVVVFADDCEKFGLWPGTHEWVYGRSWLDRFFEAMSRETRCAWGTFRSYRAAHPPRATVDVPVSSYGEMMEWSGGTFDNFFEKYSESRYMRDRMRHLSAVLSNGASERLPEETLRRSKEALFRAQCNCSYWHGVFGGLYLHHLRSAVYGNLIQAALPVDEEGPRVDVLPLGSGDRVRMRRGDLAAFIDPAYGAAMEELDHLPERTNLLCTLQRRPEPYHRFVVPKWHAVKKSSVFAIHQILGTKEKGLEKKLVYDGFRRHSFMDHFFSRMIEWDAFQTSSYREMGDFTDGRFESLRQEMDSVSFVREGLVRRPGGGVRMRVEKTYQMREDGRVEVQYRLTNASERTLEAAFGVEFNFSIGVPELREGLSLEGVLGHSFRCAWTGMDLTLVTDHPVTLLASPIETVSESEGGMEGTFQQLSVLLQRPMILEPGQTSRQSFCLEVSKRS